MNIDLTIPQTFTLENKTGKIASFRHYFVNEQERLQPGDTVTVSPKSSEELAYYMEIQKDLENSGVIAPTLLTEEVLQKILDAEGIFGTITDFTVVSNTLATMVIDYGSFTQDAQLTTEINTEEIWDGAQISNLANLVRYSTEKGYCIYDTGLDTIVGEAWIQE